MFVAFFSFIFSFSFFFLLFFFLLLLLFFLREWFKCSHNLIITFCFVFNSFRYGPSSCGHVPPTFPKPWRHVLSCTPSETICATPPTSSATPPTAVPGSLQLPKECCKAKKPSCSYCTVQGEWLRCEGVCLGRYSQTSLVRFSKYWETQSTKQTFRNTVRPTERVESRVFCNA